MLNHIYKVPFVIEDNIFAGSGDSHIFVGRGLFQATMGLKAELLCLASLVATNQA